MTTPSPNERAASILGWTAIKPGQFAKSGLIGSHPDHGVEFTPDFTGPGDAFLQLITYAWEQGWDFSLQRTRKATFEWLAEFTKGDASFSRESNSMHHAITYAFLATFEPEHPAA